MSDHPTRRALPVRSMRDEHGALYVSADDLKRLVQHPDVIYHSGCLLKVHMKKRESIPGIEPGWKGAVATLLGGVLMIALGESDIITDPDNAKDKN